MGLKILLFPLWTLNCISYISATNLFSEELYIKPLPSGHVASHFEFTTAWETEAIHEAIENYKTFRFNHYDYFPRPLGEIIEKYNVRELHLSLTQGLWRHNKWGYPLSDAPAGAQLWAWFNPTDGQNDDNWKGLVNALSGLICASLNFIDSSNTVSPELSFRPLGLADETYSQNSSLMRYAALPRENVCTENLTPWKKLLPCNIQSGFATLMTPSSIYSANYNSLSLHVRPTCKDISCTQTHLELVQSLVVVQDPIKDHGGKQTWSFKSLFSASLFSSCPVAYQSNIYVDITDNEEEQLFSLDPSPASKEVLGTGFGRKVLAVYDMHSILKDTVLNLQASYKKKHIYGNIPPPPVTITRFVTGYGQESGSITSKITNSGNTDLSIVFLEVLPWYLRIFLHSSLTEKQLQLTRMSKLVLARDRERGWLYEVVVQVPPHSVVELNLHFTRALLKWLEYPPDANHGFYIPAATVSTIVPGQRNISVNNLNTHNLKEKLLVLESESFVRIHSEILLISLPTPDFSMPYNVICLACTVVALAFGPIHNITTKKLVLRRIDVNESWLRKLYRRVRGSKCEPFQVEQNPVFVDEDAAEDTEEVDEVAGR